MTAETEQLSAHIVYALVAHRRWCKSRGHHFPEVMEAVLAALTAGDGPERPELDDPPETVNDRTVPLPLLVTDTEAARQLGVSARTVRRLRTEGTLPVVLVGRRRFVRPEDLAAFVANGGEQ